MRLISKTPFLSLVRALCAVSLAAFLALLLVPPAVQVVNLEALVNIAFHPAALLSLPLLGVAVDKVRALPTIVVPAGAAFDGQPQFTKADNNVRTERCQLRVTGQVDITVAGVGLRNRGSILAALTDIGWSDGGENIVQADARCMRQIAEVLADSTLPSVRLAGAGVQAATLLEEIVPIFFSAYRTQNPNETKWVEVNKQQDQRPFIVPQRLITRLASGGALAGTVTNVQATVETVYDEAVGQKPWLSPYIRQIVAQVAAANPNQRIDLRATRYLRGLLIQQDTTGEGEVSDIINSVILRGDRKSIIGDGGVPFRDLQQAQAYEMGGALPAGYLWIDFARYGRLSTLWNPNQDTNLRLELNVQPSVTGTPVSSLVRVIMVEYEKTAATLPAFPGGIQI
jgi:hypothetical protein